MKFSRLSNAALAGLLLLGATPTLTILGDEPVALATTLAQDPPPSPQLSAAEQEALDDEKAGRPVKDPKALSSAKSKERTSEKYQNERNRQKQRGQPRRR